GNPQPELVSNCRVFRLLDIILPGIFFGFSIEASRLHPAGSSADLAVFGSGLGHSGARQPSSFRSGSSGIRAGIVLRSRISWCPPDPCRQGFGRHAIRVGARVPASRYSEFAYGSRILAFKNGSPAELSAGARHGLADLFYFFRGSDTRRPPTHLLARKGSRFSIARAWRASGSHLPVFGGEPQYALRTE